MLKKPFDINVYIREIKDFPKEGVSFKDITPLLADHFALQSTVELLVEKTKGLKIDKVVAMESRGFMFGAMIAERIDAGFIPVRKPGKLPFQTYQQSYDLEYGQDVLEMHVDAIQEGENVLIHDDVLATGGTAQAAVKLIEEAGGNVVQLSFIMDLSFLNGKDKLVGHDIQSLITY